jgi:hypothetical protein
VEEAALLLPVNGVIGRVDVEDDLLWRSLVRFEEESTSRVASAAGS